MPVTPQAVTHLEAKGHDAVHAFAIGLGASPDNDILERARADGRIVITADLDYPRLLAQLKVDRPGHLPGLTGAGRVRRRPQVGRRCATGRNSAGLESL